MSAAPTWVFAGGGTGGHLTPGLAVAEELRHRDPDCRIVFVGTGRPVEDRLLGETGYERLATPFLPPASALRHPFRWLRASWAARREARDFFRSNPVTAVIGLGGYGCVPHIREAHRRGVRTVLLEQNVLPGRAVHWLAPQADLVCLTYEQSLAHLPRSATSEVTGNPVRAEIAYLQRPTANPIPFTLLVLGGSLGATPLNDAIRSILESGRWSHQPWRIIHQTGPTDVARTEWAYKQAGAVLGDHALAPADPTLKHLTAHVEPFFVNMLDLYRSASLVITRGGATTLAELACAGLPSIIVPYPLAAADHQTLNARVVAAAGAALAIPQGADPRRLGDQIAHAVEELASDSQRLVTMSQRAASLSRPDAAQRVVDRLCKLERNRPGHR